MIGYSIGMTSTNTTSVRKYRKPAVRTNTPLRTLAAWQMNPSSLTTDQVQLWQGDSMIGVVPQSSAKEMVAAKFYACINEQAIFMR